MSGSITLHPEKGVNPKLTYCPRCGGEGRDIMLIGVREWKRKCSNCMTMNFGASAMDKCGKCQHSLRNAEATKIGEFEKLPGSLCELCEEEVAEHAKIVAEGGVYWKCEACTANGVVKPSPFAADARKSLGVEPPAPCGVTFTKDTCPRCGPNPVAG